MQTTIRNGIIVAISLHLALCLALGFPWPGTDDLCYFDQAERMAAGTYSFDESPKNQRLGMIVPTYISIGLFGINTTAIAIYPLLASALSIFLIMWFLRSKPWIAFLSALLLACNVTQITFARVLFPDVILALFMFASTYLVWNRNDENVFKPMAAALLLITGFFVKQLIVLLVPYLGFLIIRDIINRRHLRFAGIFIGTSLIATATVMTLVYRHTGDWLFLINTIEENHNAAFAALDGTALWKRLSYEPLVFLSGLTGFGPLLILAALGFLTKAKSAEEAMLRELLLYLLPVFWLVSTSLQSYAPVLLLDRMWIPLLIPLCGLAAIALGKLDDYDWKKRSFATLLFVLSAVNCLMNGREGEALFYLLVPIAIGAWIIINRKHDSKTKYEPYLLIAAIPFALIAMWFVWSNSLHLVG